MESCQIEPLLYGTNRASTSKHLKQPASAHQQTLFGCAKSVPRLDDGWVFTKGAKSTSFNTQVFVWNEVDLEPLACEDGYIYAYVDQLTK